MPRAITFTAPPPRSHPHKRIKLSSRLIDPATGQAACAPSLPASIIPSRHTSPQKAKLRFSIPCTSPSLSLSSAPSLKPSLETLVCRCLPVPTSSSSTSSSSPSPHPHSVQSDLSNSRSSNPSPLELRQREAAAERMRADKAAKRAAYVPKGKGMKRSHSAASKAGASASAPAPPSPATRSRANSPAPAPAEQAALLPALGIARAGLKRTRSTQGIVIASALQTQTNPTTPTSASPIAPSPLAARRAATLSPPVQTQTLAPVEAAAATPATFPLRHAKPLVAVEMQRASSVGGSASGAAVGSERVRRETTLPRNLREYETRVGAMS